MTPTDIAKLTLTTSKQSILIYIQGGPKNGTVFCYALTSLNSCTCSGSSPFILTVALKTLDISQGSVATHLRCGGIFSDSIITNFLLILTVKKF